MTLRQIEDLMHIVDNTCKSKKQLCPSNGVFRQVRSTSAFTLDKPLSISTIKDMVPVGSKRHLQTVNSPRLEPEDIPQEESSVALRIEEYTKKVKQGALSFPFNRGKIEMRTLY